MNNEVSMSVSGISRTDDKKVVYVLFKDNDKEAEFVAPDGKLLNNKGFTDGEIEELKEYIINEKDSIFALAKGIDPLGAILGK